MSKSTPASGLIVLPKETNVDQILNFAPLFLGSEAPTHLLLVKAGPDSKPEAIVELHHFAPPYGSFIVVPSDGMVAPQLCRNGNLTFVTRVDPLFAVLPLLHSRRGDFNVRAMVEGDANAGVFQPLSALAVTEDGIDLTPLFTHSQLALLCDVKTAFDDTFYRLSDEKTLDWLCQKYDALQQNPHINDDQAVDLIASYLPPKWAIHLRAAVSSKDTKVSVDAEGTAEEKKDPQAFQTASEAPSLAMSVMTDEARANQEALRVMDREQSLGGAAKPGKRTSRKATAKPVVTPSASTLKFWAAQGSQSGNGKNKSNGKRKRPTK